MNDTDDAEDTDMDNADKDGGEAADQGGEPAEEKWDPLKSKAFLAPGYVVKRSREGFYHRRSDAVKEFIFASVVDYARKGKRYFASMETIARTLGIPGVKVRQAVYGLRGFIDREGESGGRKRPWKVKGLDFSKMGKIVDRTTIDSRKNDCQCTENRLKESENCTPHIIKGVSGSVLTGTNLDLKVDGTDQKDNSSPLSPPPSPEVLNGRALVAEFDSLIRSRWKYAEIFKHRKLDYTVAEELCSRLGILDLGSFRSAIDDFLDSVTVPSAANLTVKSCKEFLFITRLGKKPRVPRVEEDAGGEIPQVPYVPRAVSVMPSDRISPEIAVMNGMDTAGEGQMEALRYYGVILTAAYLKSIHPSSDPAAAISATIRNLAGKGEAGILRDITRATMSYSPGSPEGVLLGDWETRFRGILATDGITPSAGSSPRYTVTVLERLREFAEGEGWK